MNEASRETEFLNALNSSRLTASPQVLALLEELRVRLQALAEHGAEHRIDLRSLPMSADDHDLLIQFLGRGEVSAEVNALGLSKINESRFSGVWLTTHYNHYAEIIAELIEVTPLPDILKTQVADLHDGVDTLHRYLQKLQR